MHVSVHEGIVRRKNESIAPSHFPKICVEEKSNSLLTGRISPVLNIAIYVKKFR